MNTRTLFGVLTMATVVALAGCTVNTTKKTSWGKPGVSKIDYQTDTLLCATLADRATPDNGAKTAGGINGQNSQPRTGGQGDAAITRGGSGGQSSSNANSLGGGTYEGHASPDMVSRAANQQQAQIMALKQAKADALQSCLVDRGYSEFNLTSAQQAELAKLPQGSQQRLDYLYKLGADPATLKSQASTK